MNELPIRRDRRAARWVLAYLLATLLLPAFLAWFFAGLEGGYEGSGQLAPGFKPLVFVCTPVCIFVVAASQFSLAVGFKQLRPLWLLAILAIGLFTLGTNPVQRWWCTAAHVCWVG